MAEMHDATSRASVDPGTEPAKVKSALSEPALQAFRAQPPEPVEPRITSTSTGVVINRTRQLVRSLLDK